MYTHNNFPAFPERAADALRAGASSTRHQRQESHHQHDQTEQFHGERYKFETIVCCSTKNNNNNNNNLFK